MVCLFWLFSNHRILTQCGIAGQLYGIQGSVTRRLVVWGGSTIVIFEYCMKEAEQPWHPREIKGQEKERSVREPSPLKEQFPNDSNFQNQNLGKSTTKLPPLKQNKVEEKAQDKLPDLAPPPNLERRVTEQCDRKSMVQSQNSQNAYVIKRVVQKKKLDKKKNLQDPIKPEWLTRYSHYQSMLFYLNLSNNLKVQNGPFEKPYRYYVGKGNNGALIKNIFKQNRPWWVLEENPDAEAINLQWFQLRQNHILQDLKSVVKGDAELEKAELFLEEEESGEQQEKMSESVKPSSRDTAGGNRSQSLIGKDQSLGRSFYSRKVEITNKKRTSSKSRGVHTSTDKNSRNSPLSKQLNFKELKEEGMENEGSQSTMAMKKNIANPKMWPIYFNYRKIFSASEMKKIKRMGILREDGLIHGKLGRYGSRVIDNKSHNLTIHNHLENNWHLSNKKALLIGMKNYYELVKVDPFDYIPITYHVEKHGDKEYSAFIEEYHRRAEQIVQDERSTKKPQYKNLAFRPKKRNAWLVKPGENTNRGNGIEVVESLEEIQKIVEVEQVDKQGRPRTYIIQEYIMPFLYHKRKFDIRCYILMTSVNGCQKGYWYQDGYIRTASKEFSMKNLGNKMIHLTNDAVQKKSDDYGKYEPGNKLSFADFQRYLDTNFNAGEGAAKLRFWQQAYPEMKKIATDAIKAVYTKINPNHKEFSFEIFGLDFLIDENFKVWLIEANTNPCLELSSPLLGRIIPSMLENAFRVAVDPIFPPPPLEDIVKMCKKVSLPQNPIENNKFELVFDEYEEGTELKAIMTNAPELHIYNIDEEEDEYDEEGNACPK